jgi:ribose 5-phosphate isomerase B
MRVVIGADHRGVETARELVEKLAREGYETRLAHSCDGQAVDYPERAWDACHMIKNGEAELGVLVCGTGIGMSIAANKIPGIRAAVAHDELTAQLSRSHNDANVLCISADLLGLRLIEKIVEIFLKTPFEGGRHQRRVNKIAAMERGENPATVTG